MVCGVKLRRVVASIMRRRKGVMCGSFAIERVVDKANPVMLPHRSGGEVTSNRSAGTAPGTRRRGAKSRGENGREKMLRPTGPERELVLAHRGAV